MKRFMIVAACASVLTTLTLASSEAQDRPASFVPFDKLKVGQRYSVPDLAVVEFAVAYDGTNYHVGGMVKNIGSGEYTRTRDVSGAIVGRQVKLYSLPTLKIARVKLLRTFSIPDLKAKGSFTIPSITISPHELAATKGNARFLLAITAGDADRPNDSKEIAVSLVR